MCLAFRVNPPANVLITSFSGTPVHLAVLTPGLQLSVSDKLLGAFVFRNKSITSSTPMKNMERTNWSAADH